MHDLITSTVEVKDARIKIQGEGGRGRGGPRAVVEGGEGGGGGWEGVEGGGGWGYLHCAL